MPESGAWRASTDAFNFRDEASAAYEARKELGPNFEGAVLESFVARVAESIDQRVDARVEQHGLGKAPQKLRREEKADDSHLAVPVFSVFFGVIGSIWLTAGANAESDAVFAMWLGITMINIVFVRLLKKVR